MVENGVVLPRFFKVFLPEMASESMAIPMSFVEHLNDPLPQKAKLQGSGEQFWTVGLKKIHERVYFTVGWSKFVADHDLKNGEFLTFVYDGYRTFDVSVYGCCGLRETRVVTETIELSDSEEERDSSMYVDDDDDTNFGEDEEISQSIYPLDSEETDTNVPWSSNLEVATNPCFDTHLKTRIYELLIPANVMKDHKLKFGDRIKYIDGEGSLEGRRGKWTDDRICFKGWDKICRRNKLTDQDTVKCELLHIRKLVHSIKIIQITRGAT